MDELIKVTGKVARIVFDEERKLIPKHKYIRAAIAQASREFGSPRSVSDMVFDHFTGHPYLVQALAVPFLKKNETVTVDQASDWIDAYLENGGTPLNLQNALMEILADYLHIELTKTEDEGADVPNAASPAAPGRSID